jgi:hypothetical protein
MSIVLRNGKQLMKLKKKSSITLIELFEKEFKDKNSTFRSIMLDKNTGNFLLFLISMFSLMIVITLLSK